MSEIKTYKDLNIPNPTIRNQFLPQFKVILENYKVMNYKFEDPEILKKGIELKVTNGVGYTKPSKKHGKKLSKSELLNYLKEFDSLVEENKNDLRKEELANLIIRLDNYSLLLGKALDIGEIAARKYSKLVEKIDKHNEYMKKQFDEKDLVDLSENSDDKKKIILDESNATPKPKRKSLISRIFN